MKNIQKTIIVTVSILVLSACGGGGSTKTKAVVLTDTNTKVEKCTSSKMTTLKKDAKVTALEKDTKIRITHIQDGTKMACVINGNAKIN